LKRKKLKSKFNKQTFSRIISRKRRKSRKRKKSRKRRSSPRKKKFKNKLRNKKISSSTTEKNLRDWAPVFLLESTSQLIPSSSKITIMLRKFNLFELY